MFGGFTIGGTGEECETAGLDIIGLTIGASGNPSERGADRMQFFGCQFDGCLAAISNHGGHGGYGKEKEKELVVDHCSGGVEEDDQTMDDGSKLESCEKPWIWPPID